MSLNESIVENATLEWFGEQSRRARTLTRPLPGGEETERRAIRRLNAAIREEASATHKESLWVQIERRQTP